MRAPVVGLAFGSGGAKGFAHIGVLKALEASDIPVHVIAGTSIGSLIGAFYATGMTARFMERLATTLRFRHWVDLTVPKMGMIVGDKVLNMVSLLTRGLTIEEANLPLAIVATELLSRTGVTFRSGSIAKAVRASISIPGVFIPYVTEQGVFVDGGVVERVPVLAARQLGADVVIGVDVGASVRNIAPDSMVDVIMQALDIMQEQVYATQIPRADIMIVPELSNIGTSNFNKATEAIEAGYQATLLAIPTIREVLHQNISETS